MRKKDRKKNLMLLNYEYGGKFQECRVVKGIQTKRFCRNISLEAVTKMLKM
jgi:hypothetical protein